MRPDVVRRFAAYHGLKIGGYEQDAIERIRAHVFPGQGLLGRDRVVAAIALCELADDLFMCADSRWFGQAYRDSGRGALVKAGIIPDDWAQA